MVVCEACWAEAQRRHLGGEGETVVEVYNKLLDERPKCPHADLEPKEDRE